MRRVSRPSKLTLLSQQVKPDDSPEEDICKYNMYPNSALCSFVVRTGDIEAFALLEVIQNLLKSQIEALESLLPLPDQFPEVVKNTWLGYVSCLNISYNEEEIASKQRLASVEELSEDEPLYPDQENLLKREDESYSPLAPHRGRITLAIVISILSVACIKCNLPLVPSDIRRFILDGKIPYTHLKPFISPSLESRLTHRQLSVLRNPVTFFQVFSG